MKPHYSVFFSDGEPVSGCARRSVALERAQEYAYKYPLRTVEVYRISGNGTSKLEIRYWVDSHDSNRLQYIEY